MGTGGAEVHDDRSHLMAVMIGGEQKRIGPALSGGGFRAAGFHLGAMQKLQELRLLDKVDVLSCVSGGSIAGGVLVSSRSQTAALGILSQYLATRSIAVASVVGGLLDPLETRLEKLADS